MQEQVAEVALVGALVSGGVWQQSRIDAAQQATREALARVKAVEGERDTAQEETRLARANVRVVTFAPIGAGTTPTGKVLPGATITRASGDQHRYSTADRDVYTGVRAYWHDKGATRRKSALIGQSGNAKRLRESYSNEAEAREQANAEWQRIQRGAAKFSYTLALGRADLYPEQRLRVSGFKPEIDDTDWLIEQVVHRITDSSGFTTSLDLEISISA